MILEEAIEVLGELLEPAPQVIPKQKQEAIQLGIEALKREQAEAKEVEGIVQFAYKVALAMDALRSSHVFFILQQAFGDETEWRDAQEILTNIIKRAQDKLKEWEN